MIKLSILAATAAAAVFVLPVAAQAGPASLPVGGTVTPFCSIGLGNVSSGTLSLAETGTQRIATMKMSCNSIGTKLESKTQYGDFRGPADASSPTGFQIINYDWSLVVPGVNSTLGWTPEDRNPGSVTKVTTHAGYNLAMAQGVDAEFFLHTCYNGNANQQCNGSDSAAITAPAGTYVENFSFELKPA